MSTPRLRFAFGAFHATLALVVFTQSLATVLHGLHAPGGPQVHLVAIGGIEALGALLFLFGPTLQVGGALMLTAFGVALAVHGVAEGASLLVYAAGTVFVMAHGAVWSHAAGRRENVAAS